MDEHRWSLTTDHLRAAEGSGATEAGPAARAAQAGAGTRPMNETPLVPSPVYGLRAWTVVGETGGERLAGPYRSAAWPAAGAWLESTCELGHASPAPDCACGIHAWHPRRRSGRHVLAARAAVPGVVEASGAVEVHADGFRAQRARPYALVDTGWHPALVRRLAATYGVPVVEAGSPAALVDWCRERDLGLEEAVVGELLGPAAAPTRRTRPVALRVAAAVVVVGLLLLLGLVATDTPGDRTLNGRTGEVQGQR